MQEKVVRYSEAFKLQVIKELEDGTLESIDEARRVYEIGGSMLKRNMERSTYARK